MQKNRSISSYLARVLLAGAALFMLAQPREAHAQTKHSEHEQHVAFDDDLLNANLEGPLGGPIFAPHLRPPRATLIRPRTNFVPELYKSVENI